MTSHGLPRVVLGHNQFFGVDHLSSQRGKERASHFSDIHNVIEVVHHACSAGAGGLMLSTHPHAIEICDSLRRDGDLRNSLQVFPLLPYAQKYVTRANEIGLLRAATATFFEASVRDRVGLGTDLLRIVAQRNPIDMVRALMRLELRMFRRLEIPVVFLHDVFSDLLLALSMPQVFEVFSDTLKNRFGARAGLATKNLPLLLERFTSWGLEPPVILTHVNKVGFHVNPTLAAQESALGNESLEVMAMGTLASGFLMPSEASEYVRRFTSVKSVVIGASSEAHLRESLSYYL